MSLSRRCNCLTTASLFVMMLASSLTLDLAANLLRAQDAPSAVVSLAGSTNVLPIWHSIPWAVAVTGPMNLSAPKNEGFEIIKYIARVPGSYKNKVVSLVVLIPLLLPIIKN